MSAPRISLLLQSLTVYIAIVFLWSASLQAHAQVIAKCWVFSPSVDESSINVVVSTVDTLHPQTGRQLWGVSARVTWDRPIGLDTHSGYAVGVLRMPSFRNPRFCQMEDNESITKLEEFTFTGLDFGFLYEFTVFVVNSTGMSKSLVGISKGFGTPDCFQATADRDYCTNAEVQYAGAPLAPRQDALCQQGNGNILQATLSWEQPIQLQLNGEITAYMVQYSVPGAPAGTLPEIVTAMPELQNSTGRVVVDLVDLRSNETYIVLISAFVTNTEDGSFNEGLQVEMKLQTTGTSKSIPVCTLGEVSTFLPTDVPRTVKATPSAPLIKNRPSLKPSKESISDAPPTAPTTPGTEQRDKPTASPKRAGIIVAACMVSLGVVCAVAMAIIYFVRERHDKKPKTSGAAAAKRPDTNGAVKGTKTTAPQV